MIEMPVLDNKWADATIPRRGWDGRGDPIEWMQAHDLVGSIRWERRLDSDPAVYHPFPPPKDYEDVRQVVSKQRQALLDEYDDSDAAREYDLDFWQWLRSTGRYITLNGTVKHG